MFELTVLGKYGPYPKAGGACSSYLMGCGNAKILLDAGCGSFANLRRHMDFRDLDAIIISHLHSDHISDLLVMRYAVQVNQTPPFALYLPGTPGNMHEIFAAEKAFKTESIRDGMRINIKDAQISFRRMTHSVEGYAVKIKYRNQVFVYSGDTSQNDSLAAFAGGCDLLLADAQFLSSNLPSNPPHMSSAQAAAAAKKAGAKKLMLSHMNPEQDEEAVLTEAKAVFENSIVAEENKVYRI